jgi:hypothetical protein
LQENNFPIINKYEFKYAECFYFGNVRWHKNLIYHGSINDPEYYFVDLKIKKFEEILPSSNIIQEMVNLYKNNDEIGIKKFIKKNQNLYFIFKNTLLTCLDGNDYLYINNSFYCLHCLNNKFYPCKCKYETNNKKFLLNLIDFDPFILKQKNFFIEQKNYLIAKSLEPKYVNFIKAILIYSYNFKRNRKREFLSFLLNLEDDDSDSSSDDYNLNNYRENYRGRGRGNFQRHYSRNKNNNIRSSCSSSESNSKNSNYERSSCHNNDDHINIINENKINNNNNKNNQKDFKNIKNIKNRKKIEEDIYKMKLRQSSPSDFDSSEQYSEEEIKQKNKKIEKYNKLKQFSNINEENFSNKIRMVDENPFINLKNDKYKEKKLNINNQNIKSNVNIIFKIKLGENAYKCFLCEKILNKKDQFNQHFQKCFKKKLNYILNNDKIKNCPYCNFHIDSKNVFSNHMKEEHFFIFNNL